MSNQENKRVVSAVFGKVTKNFEVIESPIPHCFIDSKTSLRGWYQDKDADKPRTCTSEHFLMTPYRGCVGANGKPVCTFCYLPGMRGYYSTGVVCVDKNYPEYVRQDLEKLNVAFPAYFSPFCETFNELEPVYHMTEQAARVCNEFNVSVLFTTKRQVPDWAWEVLKQSPYSSLQVSINTFDNETWNKVAPVADDVDILLENLRTCKEQGVYSLLRIDPILPFITKFEDIEALVDYVVEEGIVDHIVFSFAEFGYAMRKRVFALYSELFPDEYPQFEEAYSESFGGNYIVDTELRVEFFHKMAKKLEGTDITMSTCSELVKDETGKLVTLQSVYPELLTSVSCHGIRVPVHYKGADGLFHPYESCHGACLHCSSNACGETLLNKAKANDYSSYKKMRVYGKIKGVSRQPKDKESHTTK